MLFKLLFFLLDQRTKNAEIWDLEAQVRASDFAPIAESAKLSAWPKTVKGASKSILENEK
jgi:hypothetical protein